MWNELRSAAEVARLGTLSGAAQTLGVHRATINRHIETLENDLGAKLFQRHARGYVTTDLGQKLIRIMDATTEQIDQLRIRAEGSSRQISSKIVITSIDVIAPTIITAIKPLFSLRSRLQNSNTERRVSPFELALNQAIPTTSCAIIRRSRWGSMQANPTLHVPDFPT